jgi:hypothetical protein
VLGLLGRWVILAQTRRTSRHLADDLRYFVETGTPRPANNASDAAFGPAEMSAPGRRILHGPERP